MEFLELFAVDERVAIRGSSDPVVGDFLAMVSAAGMIDLESPFVSNGLAYLVAQGLLTQARADRIGAA